MRFNDAVSGAVLLVLALAVIVHSRGFAHMPGQFVGPGLFPSLIAGMMAAGAVILIVRGVMARAAGGWVRLDEWTGDGRLVARFLAVPFVLLAYILLAESIGFVPVAFAGLVLLFAVGGVRWGVGLPAAAITTAAVYYAFAVILRVPLPRMDLPGVPF